MNGGVVASRVEQRPLKSRRGHSYSDRLQSFLELSLPIAVRCEDPYLFRRRSGRRRRPLRAEQQLLKAWRICPLALYCAVLQRYSSEWNVSVLTVCQLE